MKDIKVVHCKREAHDLYIGRPSRFGNPFVIGRDGSREDVLRKYREWLLAHPKKEEMLQAVRGKTLGCWCSPQRCHGDILKELAEAQA